MNGNLLLNTATSIGDAALYAALGFLVVFVGIAFLIFVVWAVGKIFTKNNTKSEPVVAQKPVATQKSVVPQSVEEEISEETVAVIMAALTAYYESVNVAANSNCEFIVRRIKRI